MYKIILLLQIATLLALPLEDAALPKPTTSPADEVKNELEITISPEVDAKLNVARGNMVMFLENFRDVMAAQVFAQNKNLTEEEKFKIKSILETFLIQFGDDLKQVINEDEKDIKDVKLIELDDGLSNDVFVNIKKNMMNEFPRLQDGVVNEIVNRLRKNLFVTKKNLNEVIKASV